MRKKISFQSPVLLEASHCVEDFDCGNAELNNYIRRFALINNRHRAARTFVTVGDKHLAGYYTLTIGSVSKEETPRRISKGQAKYPVPVIILARLAVDRRFQGRGVGQSLLKDALLRIAAAADEIGGRAVLVHAKNDAARAFYMKFGFEPSPTDPFHLYLLLKDIKKTIQG
ncbi:MAG: GNAT family N-acetyltransferase [Candidatus Omnitrophica bacterium]|nr:GNAT family N-acetyltransferase [Candidatus Omnitrophota bacterium]